MLKAKYNITSNVVFNITFDFSKISLQRSWNTTYSKIIFNLLKKGLLNADLFHILTYFASIVETEIVISSKTSVTIFTVSSDVKIVTPFSVAQRRIKVPSS